MKKSFLFVGVLLLLGSTNLSAQKFGLQAGPSFSSGTQKVSIENVFSTDINYKTFTTFTGGIYGKFDLGKTLAIQPEVNFLQKGGKSTIDGEKMDAKVNYLEIPIYVLYHNNPESGFFAGIGPSFNIGISGKYKIDGEEEDVEFWKNKDIQKFHMGINGQMGYQWENGLNINAFFSQTITNSKSEMEVLDEEITFKASNTFNFITFGLRLGYRFNAGQTAGKSQIKTVF